MILLDDAGEFYEMFKSAFPLSFLFFLPILVIISPNVAPVGAAHEFSVFRMQQFDLHGTQYGCRNAIVNLEARPLNAKTVTRRCILAKLKDLSMEKYRELVSNGAGALVILLPAKDGQFEKENVEHLQELEQGLLAEETTMPVYFMYESDEILPIYADIEHGVTSDQAASAVEALLGSATANGFQMVVSGGQSKAMSDFKVANLQGKLSGFGIEEQLPTIAIVAHYDSFAASPSLAAGADSNGSGVIAILELARLFSKLYTNARTHAKFNFLFLLSGGGKFNYQGTKRWIEDNQEMETSLLTDVSFVLCLDAIGASDELYLHVSKPPKDDSSGANFYEQMKQIIDTFHPEVKLEMVHKKINLANDYLAWEHERFSVRRLPAYTLSRFESHKNLSRTSMTDTKSAVDINKLTRNIAILAEALARHIYNNLQDSKELKIFNDKLKVEPAVVDSWLDQLTSDSRAAQILEAGHASVQTLHDAMEKYLKDVKKLVFKADKRDPEFLFYDGHSYKLNAYGVKPAVLDLFLGLMIAGYLALVYLILQNFPLVRSLLTNVYAPSPVTNGKMKAHYN